MNAVKIGSEPGNFNAELFKELAPLCLFSYVEEWRKKFNSPNERAVLLLENCAIHVTDEY